MPATIRLKPLDRTILFAPGRALSPEAAAKKVAAIARAAIAEADAVNAAALGRPAPHTSYVNGVQSEAFEDVRPGQSIVAVFDLASDLLAWILDQLRQHAPVVSGRYRNSILMFADGAQVDTVAAAISAEEIVFTSVAPYARKIEGGNGRKPESSKAPNGVFQAVAEMAKRRFGNQAKIRFAYREPTGGANDLESWARQHSDHAEGVTKRHRQYLKDVRQPAVVVTLR